MVRQFCNEDVFNRLRELYTSGDRESFAVLLCEVADPVITVQLRKSVFAVYTAEDRQDARQDALLYLLDKAGTFLENPANDPSSDAEVHYSPAEKQAWLHKTLFNGLRHSMERIHNLYARTISMDAGTEDDEDAPALHLASDGPAPGEKLLSVESAEEACRAFYSLNNTPSLLACVGYLILAENLDDLRIPLDRFAAMLNGTTLKWVIDRTETLLAMHGYSCSVLSPLKERISEEQLGQTITGLTPQSLSNRKNSMLKTLRGKISRD